MSNQDTPAEPTPLQRWELEHVNFSDTGEMLADDDGDWVRYADLDPLTKAGPAMLAALVAAKAAWKTADHEPASRTLTLVREAIKLARGES